MNKKPVSILFVCTGNICRSPTAEALFRHAVRSRGLEASFTHDSAGVASHHIGHAPDVRSQKATKDHGIDMSDLRARDVRPSDFYDFDLILAMDQSHFNALKKIEPEDATAEIALHLPHTGHSDGDVPDPYYGETADFEQVYELLDAANEALLKKLGQ